MRIVLLCIAIGLLSGGCRNRMDPSVDLLESELRWMEDQLYLLDDQLQEKCAQLASSNRENLALRQELGQTASQGSSAGRSMSPSTSAGRRDGIQRTSPPVMPKKLPGQRPATPHIAPSVEPEQPPQIPSADELVPPNIELGSPVEPSATNQHRSEPLPHRHASFLQELTRLQPTALPAPPDDSRVRRIVMNRRLTGGYDFDGRSGHEGLYLVVEPQNEKGEYVAVSAPLTVMVLDPMRTDMSSRVARWNFSAVETASHMRRSLVGKGIHLQLPWPHQPPTREKLEVLAKYETPDGRELEARQLIHVHTLTQSPAH